VKTLLTTSVFKHRKRITRVAGPRYSAVKNRTRKFTDKIRKMAIARNVDLF